MMLASASSTVDRLAVSMQVAAENDAHQMLATVRHVQWLKTARKEQLCPDKRDEKDTEWDTCLWLAGRGFGKTKVGAEDAWIYSWENPETRYAVIAPTAADVRDTCFEGVSGILNCCPAELIESYNRTLSEVNLINGSKIKGFSADEPQRMRGPNHHRAWADEIGAWRYPDEAMAQIDLGLRLGKSPKLLITTTPIPSTLIKSLTKQSREPESRVRLITGSTFANERNLSATFIRKMRAMYEGTRLGRQELYAELLEDTPGALWTLGLLDKHRVAKYPALKRIVIGLDPSVTANADSDETGIIVAARGEDDHGYVLADHSVSQALPSEWSKKAVEVLHAYDANLIVAEVNNGGKLVIESLHHYGANVPVEEVRASVGKFARAEPISILYERGIIHHVGNLSALESQLTTYVPGQGKKSPDRLDALVWALAKLFPIDEVPEQEPAMIEVLRGQAEQIDEQYEGEWGPVRRH